MAWEEIAVNLGVAAAKKFFESIAKKKDDFISISLSVGYFYNFLDPVSDKISSGDFKIYKNIDDKDPLSFDTDNIKMNVIVPGKLDAHTYNACEAEFKKYSKGMIFLNRNNRWYGINYGITQTAVGSELLIVDLARPLLVVKHYYEQVLKRDTGKGDAKWLSSQLAEISAFKESLRRLQELGYGVLVDKLDFREIG